MAFTRENDAEAVAANLPDRPIPVHANLVTPAGLAAIDAELAAARIAHAQAQAGDAIASDRSAMARATRDLRYWAARRASAQLVEARRSDGRVGFGHAVTIENAAGVQRRWTIVGDDEADPAQGSVSWVSPLASAVIGRAIGDLVTVAGHEVEIIAID